MVGPGGTEGEGRGKTTCRGCLGSHHVLYSQCILAGRMRPPALVTKAILLCDGEAWPFCEVKVKRIHKSSVDAKRRVLTRYDCVETSCLATFTSAL